VAYSSFIIELGLSFPSDALKSLLA